MYKNAIENLHLPLSVFAELPLERIAISSFKFEPGRFVDVDFLVLARATKLPTKWQDFNTISMTVRFAGVRDLRLQDNDAEVSSLSFTNEDGDFRVIIVGQLSASFLCQGGRADNFAPGLLP